MCFAILGCISNQYRSGGFNSLFVGMCFAMKAGRRRIANSLRGFNSLFVGMCFAIAGGPRGRQYSVLDVSIPFSSGCALQWRPSVSYPSYRWRCFNSLFVGMCFAIGSRRSSRSRSPGRFQFPFRRDVLCNNNDRRLYTEGIKVSIPFSSGCALQLVAIVALIGVLYLRFNSLFVGMCFAIGAHQVRCRGQPKVSIPFSSGCALQFNQSSVYFMKR